MSPLRKKPTAVMVIFLLVLSSMSFGFLSVSSATSSVKDTNSSVTQEEVTVKFEELPGDIPTKDGMNLKDEYWDSHGFRFVPDNSEVPAASVAECDPSSHDALCDSAHSGKMVIAPAMATEFSNYPIEIKFKNPQKRVSLYVNNIRTEGSIDIKAKLAAVDEDGNPEGSESVWFGNEDGWQKLEVGSEHRSASISRVYVTAFKEGRSGPPTNDIIIDDLSFLGENEVNEPSEDTEPPSVSVRGPSAVWYDDAESAGIRFNVDDNVRVENVTYRVNDESWKSFCGDSKYDSCPSDGVSVSGLNVGLPIEEDTHRVELRGCDVNGLCTTESVDIHVNVPDPIEITDMSPENPKTDLVLRERPRKVYQAEDKVTLEGSFHEDMSLWVFADCSSFPNYCDYKKTIDGSKYDIKAGGNKLEVEIPDELHTYETYFWAIRDGVKTRRGDFPWVRSDTFRITEPSDYPKIYGFQFENAGGSKKFRKNFRAFSGTFGKSAYYCGPGGNVCGPPRPGYMTYFSLVYWPLIGGAIEGSCYGMASTSQLMATREDFSMVGQPNVLSPEDFDEDAEYPVGLGTNSCKSCTDSMERLPPKPAKYGNWPREPDNLWAVIRSNHGVQLSSEAFKQLAKEHGVGRRSSPSNVLKRIEREPLNWVLCMQGDDVGDGHCVTPYDVEDINSTASKIYVYDNNYPENRYFNDTDLDGKKDESRSVGKREVVINKDKEKWKFDKGNETWTGGGKKIYIYPLSVWGKSRHSPLDRFGGFRELVSITFAGDAVHKTSEGEIGKTGSGFKNTIEGAFTVTPFTSTQTQETPPTRSVESVPFVIPAESGAPIVEINPNRDEYRTFLSRSGNLFHLRVRNAVPGETDVVETGYDEDGLSSIEFLPETSKEDFTVTAGAMYTEEREAVFKWSGLSVEGGDEVEFESLDDERGVAYTNKGGYETHHYLVVDIGDATGEEPRVKTKIFGPFEVSEGETHKVTIDNWENLKLKSETDTDGDGDFENETVVDGVECNVDMLERQDNNKNGIPDGCEGSLEPLPEDEKENRYREILEEYFLFIILGLLALVIVLVGIIVWQRRG